MAGRCESSARRGSASAPHNIACCGSRSRAARSSAGGDRSLTAGPLDWPILLDRNHLARVQAEVDLLEHVARLGIAGLLGDQLAAGGTPLHVVDNDVLAAAF